MGQPLAAIFRVGGQPCPARLNILIIGFLKALRRADDTVFVGAPLQIAHLIQRLQDLFTKLARLFKHR